jgi:putative nucleotidyltransferase with HDIG domain
MIDGVKDLPTPPLVFTQISKVVNDPNKSAYDIAAILSEDPAMSAKVLKITNSAYYGLSGTVTSVKHAIVIIGLESLKSLVISASLIDMFKGDRVGHEFQDRFWRHSLAAAFGSRVLMRAIRPQDFGLCELAFSAGLLHDIGKMVMYLQSPQKSQAVMKNGGQGGEHELQTERELFGFDHAAVGGALAERWKMPPEIYRAIAHHHEPTQFEDPLHLVEVIHVADALSYHALSEDSENFSAPRIEPGVFDRAGLALEQMSQYAEALKQEYVKAETFIKMARGEA